METEQVKPEGVYGCAERGTDSALANKVWSATGEFRPHRKGEWFIWPGKRSGEARRAHFDIDSDQWIATEVTA